MPLTINANPMGSGANKENGSINSPSNTIRSFSKIIGEEPTIVSVPPRIAQNPIGIKSRDPEQTKRELGLDWAGGPGDLPELLRRADAVMLCLPLSLESRSLLDAEAFSNMKPDAFLINLSRGGLVDRDALHGALASGKIAGVGLDVYWEEPPDPSDPIFGYNVLATPHVGGSTDRSMRGIVAAVAENIQRVEAGEEPMYRKES